MSGGRRQGWRKGTCLERVREQSDAPFRDVMAALDKNGDDKISVGEAKVNAGFADAFKQLDLNGDGFLSREELGAALIAAQRLR